MSWPCNGPNRNVNVSMIPTRQIPPINDIWSNFWFTTKLSNLLWNVYKFTNGQELGRDQIPMSLQIPIKQCMWVEFIEWHCCAVNITIDIALENEQQSLRRSEGYYRLFRINYWWIIFLMKSSSIPPHWDCLNFNLCSPKLIKWSHFYPSKTT